MKKVLIIKNLLFVFALIFMVNCSKKTDEVTPASLIGKWKDNGTIGKLTGTDNGKAVSYDLGVPASSIIVEFKDDGTALVDGDALKYKLVGSILTLTINSISFDYTISKISATELVLSFTKEQYYKYTDFALDPTSSDYKLIQNIKSNAVVEYKENYLKQ